MFNKIKEKTVKFLEKGKLLQDSYDAKQLTWSKAQKLLSNGKAS